MIPIPQPKPVMPEAAGTTPTEGTDLRSGWKEFLSHPENRAGLLQFGISMLNPANPGGTLGSNLGAALGEGMAARGATIQGEYARDAAAIEADRKWEDHQSKVLLRRAQTQRALRPPKEGGTASSEKGQFTMKDKTKEWIKYAKDAREADPDMPIATIRAQFEELLGESERAPPAPTQSTGLTAAAINQMTLEQLMALAPRKNEMTPELRAAAAARYTALGGK